MNRWISIISLITATLLQSAMAGGPAPGPGFFTCAEIAKKYQQEPRGELPVVFWAWGFMTGLNFDLSMATRNTGMQYRAIESDYEAFRNRLFDYCDRHPLVLLQDAVFELYQAMPLIEKPRVPEATRSR